LVFEAFSQQVFSGPAFARNQLVVSVQLHAAPLTQVPEQDQLPNFILFSRRLTYL
jgi:hypothetical protein